MRKFVLGILVVGMLAGTANAAHMDLVFADGSTEVTLAPSDTIEIDVLFSMNAGDTLAGITFALEVGAGLDLVGTSIYPPEWVNGSNQFEHWVNVSLTGPPIEPGWGAEEPMIGDIVLHQNDITGDYEIYIDFDYPVTVSKADASAYTLVAPGTYEGYVGYYGIGSGAPYYTDTFGGIHEAFPLIVHCVPEPGTLSLLALGGLALIRRR